MSPRGGDALHAFEVETLQEKADRIRREQGLPPEAEEGQQPCHWYDDGHGGRFLIPGCMARINDPDADTCTCRSLAEEIAKLRAELEQARHEKASLQGWHDAIVRAVYDHPGGVQIMAAAAKKTTDRT